MNRFARRYDRAGAGTVVPRSTRRSSAAQIERVRAVRAGAQRRRRGGRRSPRSTRAARGGDNLVPPIIAAVEAHATLGEIADTLRGVFGEHRDAQARHDVTRRCSTSSI